MAANPKFNFIDLYAGIGGFRYALESIGGKCQFTAEINEPAINTYSLNHEGEDKILDVVDMDKVSTYDSKKLKELVNGETIDVIAAGFPCQTFSIAGKRLGFDSEDTKGTQFFNVLKLIETYKPKIVYLENVKNLKTHDNGKTYQVIEDALIEKGYTIEFSKVLSPMHVNVPQNRERIFIIAKRKNIKESIEHFNFSKNTDLDIREILDSEYLKNNPEHNIKLKSIEEKVLNNWTKFVNEWLKHRGDEERSIPTFDLDALTNKFEPKSITPSYLDIKQKSKEFYEKHKSWIDVWIKNTKMDDASIFTNRAFRKLEWNAGINFKPKETIVQIRVSGVRFKKPNFSPTLVAVVDNPIIFDKETNKWRNMNFRELANLQSFPIDFKFNDRVNIREIYKQFGNSVNVELTKKVAEQFKHLL